MAIQIISKQSNNFSELPWSNDEINMRINMLVEMLSKFDDSRDDVTIMQLNREIATWRELVSRRLQ